MTIGSVQLLSFDPPTSKSCFGRTVDSSVFLDVKGRKKRMISYYDTLVLIGSFWAIMLANVLLKYRSIWYGNNIFMWDLGIKIC